MIDRRAQHGQRQRRLQMAHAARIFRRHVLQGWIPHVYRVVGDKIFARHILCDGSEVVVWAPLPTCWSFADAATNDKHNPPARWGKRLPELEEQG